MHETILPEIKERPSKTAQKKIAQATTKFADSLLKLSATQLSRLDLPADVLDLLLLGKKNKASSGRNRVVKSIASFLRNDEIWGSEAAIKQYDLIAKGHAQLTTHPPQNQK